MINNKVLSFEKIDDMLSYRFFLIVNNNTVQENELIPSREFYRGIYNIYEKWKKYKIDHKIKIVLEVNDLSKTKGYKEMIKQLVLDLKSILYNHFNLDVLFMFFYGVITLAVNDLPKIKFQLIWFVLFELILIFVFMYYDRRRKVNYENTSKISDNRIRLW